ncbi:hypothetical protein D3C72_1429340 [compost metagenome]
MTKLYKTRPIGRLGRLAVVAIYATLVANAFHIALAATDWFLLQGVAGDLPLGPYGEYPVHAAATEATAILRLPVLTVGLVVSLIVLKWIYRANMNAQAWTGGMRVSPPWSIGWFFIPLANLWKPFQGVADTWAASHGHPVSSEAPNHLKAWWGLWLASGVVASVSNRMAWRADTVGVMHISAGLEVVSALLSFGTGLLFLEIVKRITTAQTLRLSAADSDVFA